LEQTIKPWSQLAVGVVGYTGGRKVMEAKPSLVADCELHVAARTISPNLHVILGLEETVTNISEEDVSLLQLVVQSHHPSKTRPVGRQRGWRAAVNDLKWRCLQSRVVR